MDKKIKLYNIIAPLWFLVLMPQTWIFGIVINILWDILVTTVIFKAWNVQKKREKIKKIIGKIWFFGFAAGILAEIPILLLGAAAPDGEGLTGFASWWEENLSWAVMYDPLHSIPSFLIVTLCILLAGWCIYKWNKKYSLKQVAEEEVQRKKMALALAVCTAPYSLYVSSAFLFENVK